MLSPSHQKESELAATDAPISGDFSAVRIAGNSEVSATATAVESGPWMNSSQTAVLIAEVSIIEKRAHRATVLLSDNVSALHLKLDECIKTEQVPKQLLEELRDKLAVLNEVSLLSILCSNLARRLESNDQQSERKF